MKLTNEELVNIQGGAKLGFLWLAIAGLGFIVGIVDGWIRPSKCN